MMRARTVAVLTAGLTATMLLGACQVIVGLSGLSVTSGTGGSTSTTSTGGSSTSASSSSTGTGGDAGDPGPPCVPGTPCGQDCVGNVIRPAGTCDDAGFCPVTGSACPASGPGGLCVQAQMMGSGSGMGMGMSAPAMCVKCGTTPDAGAACPGTCAGCDQDGGTGVCVTPCIGGPCVGGCPDGGCSVSPVIIDATQGPARYECGAGMKACNGLELRCNGPFPCTVTCNGGCVNLHVTCDPKGPCTLACGDMSCQGAKLTCGENSCHATCTQAPPGTIECGDSCDCTATPVCQGP